MVLLVCCVALGRWVVMDGGGGDGRGLHNRCEACVECVCEREDIVPDAMAPVLNPFFSKKGA